MNNYEIALDATNTAVNSQGSAMTEQAKYAQTLEARITRLKNAFTELSLSVGEAFLTDAFVVGVEFFTGALGVMADTVGVLPIVLGAVSAAVLLLNKDFRTAAVSMTIFDAATKGLTISVNGLKFALRGLLAASVVGALVAALGYGLEKLISHFSNAKQEAEQMDQTLKDSADGYVKNADKVGQLVDRYKELEKVQKSGKLSTEEEEEFLKIQGQLAQILPSVKTGIDEKGNALIENSKHLEKEIELLKEKIKLEREEAIVNADSKKSKSQDEIKDLEEEKKLIEERRKAFMQQEQYYQGNEGNKKYQEGLLKLKREEIAIDEKINKEKLKQRDAYEDILKVNTNLTSQDQDWLIDMALDGKKSADEIAKLADRLDVIRKVAGSSLSTSFVSDLNGEQFKVFKYIAEDLQDGSVKIEKYRDDLEDVGFKANTVNKIMAGFAKTNGDNTKAAMEAAKAMGLESEAIAELGIEGQDAASLMGSINEQYENTSESVSVYNGLLEKMAEGKSISAAEAMDLISQEEELASAIEIENGVVKVNVDAVAQMRDTKIKAYMDSLKVIKESLKAQISSTRQAIQAELGLYSLSLKGVTTYAEARRKIFASIQDKAEREGRVAVNPDKAVPDEYLNSLEDIYKANEDLNKMLDLSEESLKEVGTEFEKSSDSTKENTKETEKAKDELKEYTYVADKFKAALEDINVQQEKLNALTNDYTDYSKGFRNTIKEEIALLRDKQKIIDEQTKSLESQIASGNVTQYGVVETGGTIGGVGANASSDFINKSVKQITAITAEQINKIIGVKAPSGSVLRGQGQAFIDAAKASGLDPLYLLAHAVHETGWGTSNIAKKKNNFYGIGAFDSSPYKSSYNYDGVKAGIVEGAKWISKNYANGKYGQDTLYKMRNNNGVHQYATDPNWDDKIAAIMTSIVSSLGGIAPAIASATDTLTNNVSNTVNKKLSGWDGKQTGNFLEQRSDHKHQGIDLAVKQGTKLDSNIAGKVTFAGMQNGYGNVVYVVDASGKEHRYAHLSKIGVKKGQQINIGDMIGNTGGAKGTYGAGRSSGAHLHYEVRENGKSIDPSSYIKQAQSGTFNVSPTSSDNPSKDAADAQQRLADAQSQLKGLQSDSVANADAIERLVDQLIQHYASRFAKKEENYDVSIQNAVAEATNKGYSPDSDQYRTTLQRQINARIGQRNQNDQEISLFEQALKTGILDGEKLNEQQLNQIKDLLKEAQLQRDEYISEQKDLEGQMVESFLLRYENKKSNYDQAIENSNVRLSRTYEGSPEYFKELEGQAKSYYAKGTENKAEIAYLEEVLKTQKLNDEYAKAFTERLQELRNVQHEIEQETTAIAKTIIDSRLTGYENKKSNYDKSLENSEIRLGRLTKGSEAYRAELEKQKASLAGKQKENADEIEYLEWAIKNYKMAPEAVKELTDQLHQLKIAQNELIDGSLQKNAEIMDDMLDELANKVDQINYHIQRTQEIMSRSEEGSPEWFKGNDDLKKLYEELAATTLSERSKLLEKLKSTSLTPEDRERMKKELNRLSLEYQGYLSDIHSLDEAELNWKEQLADRTIDVMKRAYEKEKELALAAIDEEIEALDKKHEKKMEQYDEELERINEVYNAAIDAIDKQESEDNYQKELTDLQDQRADVQSDIDSIALDNSIEAEARRAELKKQREELDKQIEELKHNREVELRKESLQDELEKNQKEVEDKRDAEQEKYEASKERLEDEKKELEYHYNEILNNERYWNELRTNIINGETDKIDAKLQGFLDNFKGKNEEVVKDLESSWQELQNLLDDIIASQNEIDEYEKNNGSKDDEDEDKESSSPTVERGKLTTGTFKSKADAENVQDKLMKDYTAWQTSIKETDDGFRVEAVFEDEERAQKVLNKLIERKLIKNGSVASFDTGGYTGDFSGGKLLLAHEKEQIFNKDDTKNIYDAAKILRNLTNFNIADFLPSIETLKSMINIPSFSAPTVSQQPSLAGGGSGDIYVNFNVDKMYGTEKEAKKFSSTIKDILKNKGKIV